MNCAYKRCTTRIQSDAKNLLFDGLLLQLGYLQGRIAGKGKTRKRKNGKAEKRVKGGKAEKRVKGGKAEKRVKGGKAEKRVKGGKKGKRRKKG